MTLPSQAPNQPSRFDRFASAVDNQTSKAWFFAACIVLVIVWAPSCTFLPIDTWQLIINTATTIITFLLVALLQNTQRRSGAAVHQKLNAMAQAQAKSADRNGDHKAAKELRAAVGLEDQESTDG